MRIHYGGRIDAFSDQGVVATPRLGLVYMPASDWAFKLLYGRAFRPPTVAEIRGAPPTIAGSTSIEPETIGTLEAVAAVQRDHFRASLTLFGSRWRDAIVLTSRAMPATLKEVR